MPRVLKPLTSAEIVKATSQTAQRQDLRDGVVPGLRLRTGARTHSWSFTTMVEGRRIQFALGSYPEMSLAEAREAATKKREMTKLVGSAPAPADASHRPTTLGELIDYYGAARGEALRSWDSMRRNLNCVFGKLMNKPLTKLDHRTFQHAADFYPTKIQAATAVRAVRPILRFARRRGFVFMEPDLIEPPPDGRKARERVLDPLEIRAVWGALAHSAHDDAIRLMFLTACRRNEVAEARWDEIDLHLGVWTIPASRAKEGRAHRVFLSTGAHAILFRLRSQTKGETVFPVPPVNNWHPYQLRLNERSGTSGWHRHDIRRTSATTLGKLGYPPHVIELVLGHKDPHTQLASVYQKHRYDEDVRAAMESLSNYFTSLIA